MSKSTGDLRSAFAHELYAARLTHGYSQAKAAEKANISTRWYQVLEKGARLPGLEVGLRLMLALNIPLEQFAPALGGGPHTLP